MTLTIETQDVTAWLFVIGLLLLIFGIAWRELRK